MNNKQEKYINILTTKIMEIINQINNQASADNTNISAQTYFLLIDIASALAYQLKIPKKEQIECVNYFIKQNKKSQVEVNTNKKIKNNSIEIDGEFLGKENNIDFQETNEISEEITKLFNDDFLPKKDNN